MDRIHVTVRARPLSPEDAKTSPWRISGNSVFLPNINSSKFEFDRVFTEESKTVEIYQCRTKDIVAAAVRGFNGTVFAYGQTNSGKTHTMRGSVTEPGVIPLAVRQLFDNIQEEVDREFLLRMSYMEIYNEEINDLLAPEHRKLQIHESLERGIFVAGLREEIVASPEQVLDLMEFGESHRHIGETNMNLHSSRSHTIFRMIIESRDRVDDDNVESTCDAVRVSVLNLVDLAGSERAAKTGAEGVRLREGSHINKSLMTLGTVIKKLSEGAESQGGHVPYRDSKLTRILQPALGGNANTAIICNITLAQVHADETKSSLQFASRALHVTNHAYVNEILTDAALLKRQKKEIEELRAKLQGSHSEHFEEEILNLRKTLLLTELERERIALELEEEKKAQVERERRLQEQAKKIENLSSMVLHSNREENRDQRKKEKRRETWCPSNPSCEVYSGVQLNASSVKPTRPLRNREPLLPFEKLVSETEDCAEDLNMKEENQYTDKLEDCTLPDPLALLHVTNRRKVPLTKKSLVGENNEMVEMQEYENLFLNFEIQTTIKDIEIDCLMRKLAVAEMNMDGQDHFFPLLSHRDRLCSDQNQSLFETEATDVFTQLQDQLNGQEVSMNPGRLKVEESIRTIEEKNQDFVKSIQMELEEIRLEVQIFDALSESVSQVIGDLSQISLAIMNPVTDIKSLAHQHFSQLRSIIGDYEILCSCLGNKFSEYKDEKLIMFKESIDLRKQIEELQVDVQNSENALAELTEKQYLQKCEFLYQIEALEKEMAVLSSCSLARERDNLRKDLEKTKLKLKEMEFKLKNAIQDKTKLEGEKAHAEKELKLLHGQKALLVRDISRRDSHAGRRRDSFSVGFDPNRAKAYAANSEHAMQEEYKRLEFLAFEMEATIASLEEELAATRKEKEEALCQIKKLASEQEILSQKLSMSNLETNKLMEEISALTLRFEESESCRKEKETTINLLVDEKEELSMQLTDALMTIEEERAIWSSKEKATVETIEEKSKISDTEILTLSKELVEVKNDLDSCRIQCKALRERIKCSEENREWQKSSSIEKSLEIDQLSRNQITVDNRTCQNILDSSNEVPALEPHHSGQKVEEFLTERCLIDSGSGDLSTKEHELDAGLEMSKVVQALKDQLLLANKEGENLKIQIFQQQSQLDEVDFLKKDYQSKLSDAKVEVDQLTKRLTNMEFKTHRDEVNNSKERAKLRMMLRSTQAKLDAFRGRYREAVDEMASMDKKYEEASTKLKERLALYGVEVLNLKKQLASANGQL